MHICSLAERFSEVALLHADKPAIRQSDGTMVTYAKLKAEVDEIAALLDAAGFSGKNPIAIVHGKSSKAYALQIATLYIGAPYCCIDERSPAAHQRLLLERLKPCIIITCGLAREEIDATREAAASISSRPRIWDLDRDVAFQSIAVTTTLRPTIGSDIAYLMFTSGSTGQPKGVAVSHDNVLNFINWTRATFDITPKDVLSNVNHMHFDNSVFDIYASLFNGACLAPVPRAELDTLINVVPILEKAGCTLLYAVPSLLVILQGMDALSTDHLMKLRLVCFAGEGFPKPELRKMFETLGAHVRIVNAYGPTECTCLCSALDVCEEHFCDMEALTPLGPMAANVRGIVLDGDFEVPDGQVGELCLVGPAVALGYYNDITKTTKVFVNNPLRPEVSERMYRSGDLVRKDQVTGVFHFVGRSDQQIQHMGHRIELGEIEAVLNAIDGVRQAVVEYRRGSEPFGQIYAFVTTKAKNVDAIKLLDQARDRLPNYMVPARIEIRGIFPQNANGKIDRKRLREDFSNQIEDSN